MRYYEDPILGKGRAADISGGTGGSGTTYIGGFAIGISGDTISRLRYMPIESVTGNSVTLQAGHAYKAYATSTAITLNTETVPEGQFGLECHIEIYVAGTGYVVTGANVVLANALEPNSVNNCTLRFHDGVCIISVEDHVAGYIVVNGATSGDGSLYYGIATSTNDYVAFDASLNGTVIPLAGAIADGEKHLVGNGYNETTLTGAIDCSTNKVTVANLGLNNVQVTGGTMTLGDAFIPSGSTVAVSGGGLAVEKVTGNGGVINLGGERITVYKQSATIQNVTLTNGKYDASPAAIYVQSSGTLVCNNATFTDNIGSGAAIVGTYRDDWSVVMSGCSIYGNTAKFGGGIDVSGSGTMNLVDCFVKDNTATNPSGNNTGDIFIETGATVIIDGGTIGNVCLNAVGNPQLKGHVLVNSIYHRSDGVAASVTISSGASINLTSSIAPGGTGGITVLTGGCTVNGNAIPAGTYTSIDSNGQPT